MIIVQRYELTWLKSVPRLTSQQSKQLPKTRCFEDRNFGRAVWVSDFATHAGIVMIRRKRNAHHRFIAQVKGDPMVGHTVLKRIRTTNLRAEPIPTNLPGRKGIQQAM